MDLTYDNKNISKFFEDVYLKGDDIQKVSVLHGLPELFRADTNATCTRIIPKILQELPNSSCEFHIATSKSFKYIIQKKIPLNVLPYILQGLESRDPIVVNAWLEVLLDVMLTISEETIRNEIFPIALTKANVSQPIGARIVGCALLGKLSIYPKLVEKDIKSVILPAIQSLCQDCSPDVRAMVCSQIPNICLGLGENLNKSTIISSLVELASDNVPTVRSSAVLTIVTIIPILQPNVKKGIILPLVKQLCEKSQTRDDTTGQVITKEFGKLINGLLPSMRLEDIVWFLNSYKVLAHRGVTTKPGETKGDPALDMVCRDNCAYNLPAVATIIANKAKDYVDVIYSIFRDLTADPCYIVRKTVAASIHEILNILAVNIKLIKTDVVRLLRDDAEEVLLALVPNLGNIMSRMSEHGILIKTKADQTTMEIGRALLKCQLELTKGYNWRLLTTLLKQQERLPECMPSDFIHQHFTPVVLGIIVNGRARPVREQACRTLLIFLKSNQKEVHQKWIRDTLIMQLAGSNSSYTRIIYIKMCRHALDVFPVQYFKEYFFMPLMALLDDPVVNIRYAVVCMLPTLKQLLSMNDPKCRQLLTDAVYKLEVKERSKIILEKMKSKQKELSDLKPQSKSSNIHRMSAYQSMNAITSNIQDKNIKSLTLQHTSSTTSASSGSSRSSASSTKKSVSYTQSKQSKPIAQVASNSAPIQTPTAAKIRTPPTPPSSDMSFLEQHFYVDAGVNIPLKHDAEIPLLNSRIPVVVSSTNDIEGLTKNEIETLQSCTTNITDDVKVNLRKITEQSSKLQQPKVFYNNNLTKINKRHSSILFNTSHVDNKSATTKTLNRRSLNIQTKDLSKIPICSKNLKASSSLNVKHCLDKENATIIKYSEDSINKYSEDDNKNDKQDENICKQVQLIDDNNVKDNFNLVPSKSTSSIAKPKSLSNLPLAIKKAGAV